MTVLALVLMRSGGLIRAALIASCTAVVTALLLAGIALLRLPSRPQEVLFEVVADPGTRPGAVLAVVLLTVPPLLLLHQAVRLGTTARERRLAGLRIAGATPADIRRIGAIEVGVPALVGSCAGILLHAALRVLLGGVDLDSGSGLARGSGLRLLPTTVGPAGWQVIAVVLGVTALGVLVGWRAASGVVVSPLGVSRRQPQEAPRPWGAVLLLLAVVLAIVPFLLPSGFIDVASTAVAIAVVALAVLGVTALASWTAYRTGLAVERRATSAAVLLAARRLVTDPRPAGRAAAAVGGISLVSGGAAAVLAGVMVDESTDAFYLTSLALVAVALLAALAVVVGSLAVHSTEALLDRKRSMAALVALGASVADLSRSQRWELLLAALPVAVVGVGLGSLTLVPVLTEGAGPGVLIVPLNLVLTPALVVLATLLATALTRPIVRRASSAEHLRTE